MNSRIVLLSGTSLHCETTLYAALYVAAMSNHTNLAQAMPPPAITSSSVKKKAPPPPPPVRGASNGHMRNPSDPGLSLTHGGGAHLRSPSDPPALPPKTGSCQARLPGAKYVLPPVAPKPRTPDVAAAA